MDRGETKPGTFTPRPGVSGGTKRQVAFPTEFVGETDLTHLGAIKVHTPSSASAHFNVAQARGSSSSTTRSHNEIVHGPDERHPHSQQCFKHDSNIIVIVLGMAWVGANTGQVHAHQTEAVLKTGRKCGRDFTEPFEAEDGIDKLEALQEHKDQKIYERTLKIIETYFTEEEEEDENQVFGGGPANGGPMTFDFKSAVAVSVSASSLGTVVLLLNDNGRMGITTSSFSSSTSSSSSPPSTTSTTSSSAFSPRTSPVTAASAAASGSKPDLEHSADFLKKYNAAKNQKERRQILVEEFGKDVIAEPDVGHCREQCSNWTIILCF